MHYLRKVTKLKNVFIFILVVISISSAESRNDITNFEAVFKETLVNIVRSRMPESKLSFQQVTGDFFKLYRQYKMKYKYDINKIVDAELKLAKIMLISGMPKKAQDIFSKVAFRKDKIGLKNKLYALYYIGKINLLYLSNTRDATFIFRQIVDNYERKNSSDTVWAVLWSKLRLAEIYENEGKLKDAEVYFESVASSESIKRLQVDDQLFIYTFITEKYLRLGLWEKSLTLVEDSLKICNEFKMIDFDWAFDWLIWIKLRIANFYYQKENFEKTTQLIQGIIESGFFNDTHRLKSIFFYNLFYNPKPFLVNKEEIRKDLMYITEILTRRFPELEKETSILRHFYIRS